MSEIRLSDSRWLIYQDSYIEENNLSMESVMSLSNGYMGTRGALEEGARISLPTTFINGIFDKSETFMYELANLPNWLTTRFNIEKDILSVDFQNVGAYRRALDMKKAFLYRVCVIEDSCARRSKLESLRFLSRNNVHRCAIRFIFTPLNYSGIVELENEIDGTVLNFADAPRFKVKHINITRNETLFAKNGLYVECETRDDKVAVACASQLISNDLDLTNRHFSSFGERSVEFMDFKVEEGKSYTIDKLAAYYTENDIAKAKLNDRIKEELLQFEEDGFDLEFDKHCEVYEKMWDIANIEIDGDAELDKAIRFNIFQLMSTANENNEQVNIGAKLLSGEEYGGHAFWDTELFMLPFFAYEFPATAKNLLAYRYNLLGAAKKYSQETGYDGARYPWESAHDGSEQCPDWTIYPDGSCVECHVAKYEQHVTSAIAYGILNYVNITGDNQFLYDKGLDVLIETAKFWNSRLEYNDSKDRYEINNVTGPDEWHEPVNNNIYTNYLARYNLRVVREILLQMKDNNGQKYYYYLKKHEINDETLKIWQEKIAKIYLPKKENSNLLEQFEGYFDLEDLVISEYDENDWPKKPKPKYSKSIQETQIIKQADVMMLMYLLSEEFDDLTVAENYKYYEPRTLHGSSLSPSIYAIMGLRVNDASKAYRYLKRAATLDLYDLQGNGREGLHAANTGGVWQTVIFGFMGLKIIDGSLHIDPKLSDKWNKVKFKINFRGSLLSVEVCKDNCIVNKIEGDLDKVYVKGRMIRWQP